MPSLQGIVWRGIKPVVQPWVMSRFRSGLLPSFRWKMWNKWSKDFWYSLDQHLINPGEKVAAEEIQQRHILRQVITIDDIENAWAASPATILFIWRQLQKRQPKTIVEMGSGVSTRLFAFFAHNQEQQGHTVPRIFSFDHDASWLELTQKRLTECSLNQFVKLVHAPLGPITNSNQEIVSYAIPTQVKEEIDKRVDFLMIDGPPKTIGRSGTLPSMVPHLAASAQIYLDDSRRPGELAAVAGWLEEFSANIIKVRGRPTIRGMAEILWRS